jgi:uncharacterized protein (DUF885 family)
MADIEPNMELARISDEFFQHQHTADPFSATMLGVQGFDALVLDPSRVAAESNARRFAGLERQADELLAQQELNEADQINAAVLSRLAWGARSDLEHGLWEANASAQSYANPQAMAFQSVPVAPLRDAAGVDDYLTRLDSLGPFFDAVLERYRQATADGRISTRVGVRQAMSQLEGYLGRSIEADTMLGLKLPVGVDHDAVRAKAADIVESEVRPAMRRLRDGLERELLPTARDDEHIGISLVPGGDEGYRAAVRRHTTTDLTPEEIHQIGLDCIRDLRSQWAVIGEKALGTSDVPEILRRLRDDRSLRAQSTEQLVGLVQDALDRAEAARDEFFPRYDIAECVIEEIDPLEADYGALAYYRPPAADGTRPGAHCVLTVNPTERFVYEYEALAFHESTPGHHLQIASAQRLAGLPAYRRFLDAEVCGYIEGWGLYSERLADEMGLYTSDLQRLGMLSFEALRACRLVVDTGMHALGWSRQRAVDFMWDNTATTRSNVVNEIDRYIGWPAQALAYMIGRREIGRLRADAEQRLGGRFDIRGFHGVVLGNAAVPLDILGQNVERWITSTASA